MWYDFLILGIISSAALILVFVNRLIINTIQKDIKINDLSKDLDYAIATLEINLLKDEMIKLKDSTSKLTDKYITLEKKSPCNCTKKPTQRKG